ncbi:MAG: Zn-ribbon domain-containing OB-fold protein [Thermaurantiacus sp.]
MEDIATQLFVVGPPPRLIGGRERATGRIVFPLPADMGRFEAIELPPQGMIWSWTVQRFRPKSPPYAGPETFAPFALAYVQLGDVLIVEGRLAGFAFEDLRVGLPCQTVLEPFAGKLSFAFGPLDPGA